MSCHDTVWRQCGRYLHALLLAGTLIACWAVTGSCADRAQDPALDLAQDEQLIARITKPVGTVPIHWRVTWQADPTTQAVVSWNTVEAGTTHRLYLRGENEEPEKAIDCQRNGRFSDPSNGPYQLHYHHARLTGLKPESKYFVQFESDGQKSAEFWFLTAPAEDKAVRLLCGGDSRSGQTQRRFMNRRMACLLSEIPEILALAHGGDYVWQGQTLEYWWLWMGDHELTVTDSRRLLPIIPARGNHDAGPIFSEVFDFPAERPNYYSVSLTPQVRLITLNSETSMVGDQQDWLERELSRSRPASRWLVVQYHTPAWPAVKSPGAALQHFVPLFEKYNVHLVCESDGHVLKRTVPIRNGKQDASGIVYVGEGGLGAGLRRPKKDRWYLQPPGMATSAHHVQLLTFHADRLDYKAVGMDGSTLDTYVIPPR
jgi:hypothetical protein